MAVPYRIKILVFWMAVGILSVCGINHAFAHDDLPIEEPAEASRMTIEQIINRLGPISRPEHPRPDRFRASWLNLNGVWEFAFDSEDKKITQGWDSWQKLDGKIVVPFCPESVLSGVYDKRLHSVCWYARNFDIPESLLKNRLLLHFGAVDYRAKVWLNGEYLGEHQGGYDPFQFEISKMAKPENNRLKKQIP